MSVRIARLLLCLLLCLGAVSPWSTAQAAGAWNLRIRSQGLVVPVSGQAALSSALGTYGTTAAPVTLLLDPAGTYTANQTYTQCPTATLKIVGSSTTVLAHLNNITINYTACNLWFENVDFGDVTRTSAVSSVAGQTGGVLQAATNITLVHDDFYGAPKDPYGDYSTTGSPQTNGISGDFTNLVVRDGYFHDNNYGISSGHMFGTLDVTNNLYDVNYRDAFYIGIWDNLTEVTYKDNFGTRFINKSSDSGNPHADFIQMSSNNGATGTANLKRGTVQGNIGFTGASRGQPQWTFTSPNDTTTQIRNLQVSDNLYIIDDPTAGSVTASASGTTLTVTAVGFGAIFNNRSLSGTGVTVGTEVTGFISGTGGVGTYTITPSQTFASTTVTSGGPTAGSTDVPSLAATVYGNVSRNRAVRSSPGYGTQSNSGKADTIYGQPATVMADNFGELYGALYGLMYGNLTYLSVQNGGTYPAITSLYASTFEQGVDLTTLAYGSRTALRATQASLIAAYRFKATGVGAALRDAYDYTLGTVDYSKARPFLTVSPLLDQALNTLVTTAWAPVWNIAPAGVAVTVPAGTEYQIANDASGTGAGAWSSSAGTVLPTQFVRLRVTTAATYSTAATFGLTIGGQPYSSAAVTLAQNAYAEIDNGGAAYSVLDTPGTEPNRQIAIVEVRWKSNNTASNATLGQSGAGNGLALVPVAGAPRFTFRSSGSARVSDVMATVDTNWHTDVFVVDFTQTNCVNVVKWFRDFVPQTVSGCPNTSGLSFDPASQLSSIVLLATTTAGAQVLNGKVSEVWIDWGDASYSIPDFSVPANFAKFLPDNINLADGSGVTGAKPKIFLYAPNAAAWNAGFLNLGLLNTLMLRPTGTYH